MQLMGAGCCRALGVGEGKTPSRQREKRWSPGTSIRSIDVTHMAAGGSREQLQREMESLMRLCTQGLRAARADCEANMSQRSLQLQVQERQQQMRDFKSFSESLKARVPASPLSRVLQEHQETLMGLDARLRRVERGSVAWERPWSPPPSAYPEDDVAGISEVSEILRIAHKNGLESLSYEQLVALHEAVALVASQSPSPSPPPRSDEGGEGGSEASGAAWAAAAKGEGQAAAARARGEVGAGEAGPADAASRASRQSALSSRGEDGGEEEEAASDLSVPVLVNLRSASSLRPGNPTGGRGEDEGAIQGEVCEVRVEGTATISAACADAIRRMAHDAPAHARWVGPVCGVSVDPHQCPLKGVVDRSMPPPEIDSPISQLLSGIEKSFSRDSEDEVQLEPETL